MSKVTLKLSESNFDPNNPYKILQGAVFDNMATHDSISQLTSALAGKDKTNKPLNDAAEKLKNASSSIDTSSKKSSDSTTKFGKAFDALTGTAVQLYKQDINVARDIKDFGGMLGNLAGMVPGADKLTKIPLGIGTVLEGVKDRFGKMFEGGIDEAVLYHRMLNDVSGAGFAFSGDLLEFKEAAGEARMSVQDYARLMNENASNFAGFGTSVSKGAEIFSKFTDELYSGANASIDELKRLGYTSADVNKLMAQQMRLARRRDMDDEAVRSREVQSVTRLAKEMDLMARLTGKSREEQQKELAKVQTDVDFQAYASLNDRDGSKEMIQRVSEASVMLQNYGPDVQQLFKEMVTRGQAVNENTILAQQNLGAEAMANIKEMANAVRQGVGPEEMQALIDKSGAAIQQRINSPQFLEMINLAQVGSALGDNARKMFTDQAQAIQHHINDVLRDNTKNIKSAQDAYLSAILGQAREDQREQEDSGDTGTIGQRIGATFETVETGLQNVGAALSTTFTTKITKAGDEVELFGVNLNQGVTGIKNLIDTSLGGVENLIRGGERGDQTIDDIKTQTADLYDGLKNVVTDTFDLSEQEEDQRKTDAQTSVINYAKTWENDPRYIAQKKARDDAAAEADRLAMMDLEQEQSIAGQVEYAKSMEEIKEKEREASVAHEKNLQIQRDDYLQHSYRIQESKINDMNALAQQEQENIKTENEQYQEDVNAVLGSVTSNMSTLSNNILTIPQPITTEIKTQTDSLIGAFAQGSNNTIAAAITQTSTLIGAFAQGTNDTIAAIQNQQPVKIIETRVEAPSPNSVQPKQNQAEIQTYLQPGQQKIDDALTDLESELNSTTADVIVEKLDKVEKVLEKSNTILDYMAGQSLTQTGMMAGNMSAKDRQSYVHAAL